jgi:D-arabinose 1-dehydrogenase-like Zn-dependent alcohol dehydrogenase
MKVRTLYTDGKGKFIETDYDKPEPCPNEIEVKAIYTGVCRSDIDMMQGRFTTLPLNMQGHEGLGQVTKLGSEVFDVRVGQYVATRGEPAYADYYNVRQGEYVRVPEVNPKYILEPVACGINLLLQDYMLVKRIADKPDCRVCVIGTGFLAKVVYDSLKVLYPTKFPGMDITVIGSSNAERWGHLLKNSFEGSYDLIIDLSSADTIFLNPQIVANQAVIILGAEKYPAISTTFSDLLWKAVTIVMPSPRTDQFIKAMTQASISVEHNIIDVRDMWTQAYDRDTEWTKAFEDGVNRPRGYNRGYIKWD